MRPVWIAIVLCVLGCSGDADTGLVGKFKGFADEYCSCEDKACADKVQNRLLDWAMKLDPKLEPRGTELDQLMKIGERFQECGFRKGWLKERKGKPSPGGLLLPEAVDDIKDPQGKPVAPPAEAE